MNKNCNILVVEDDNHINNMIRDILGLSEYKVIQAYSGTEALIYVNNKRIDLVILDLMLPGKDGKQVLAEIKESFNIPVIALTAINNIETKVDILKSGADDYITKPFDNKELIARVEVALRKNSNIGVMKDRTELVYKDIILNLETYEVKVKGQNINLSKREFEILKLLMQNPKKVFTKNNIYETVWGEDFIGDENTINVHISKLRTKLAVENSEEYIQTVWGIGFKMS
ncbi:MAG: response regulator transcription factor [Lachnospiraceae bacterium]|jgi:DNA-binding response OmpR family regulator|nr:response regulator transcription factor [Lachnospiraceae bacterium]